MRAWNDNPAITESQFGNMGFSPHLNQTMKTMTKSCIPILLSSVLLLTALAVGAGCENKAVQSSGGMAPTIKPGEQVAIDEGAYAHASPSRWDVVVIDPRLGTAPPNNTALKRVIALPMETISLTSTGIVVNGSILSFPTALSNVAYRAPDDLPSSHTKTIISFPYTVPANCFFVVGDNWADSLDSRYYGAVHATNILGRVKRK